MIKLLNILMCIIIIIIILCVIFSHYENIHGATQAAKLLKELHVPLSSNQIILVEFVCVVLLIILLIILRKNSTK